MTTDERLRNDRISTLLVYDDLPSVGDFVYGITYVTEVDEWFTVAPPGSGLVVKVTVTENQNVRMSFHSGLLVLVPSNARIQWERKKTYA